MISITKKVFLKNANKILTEIDKLNDIASVTDESNNGFVIMKLAEWEKIQDLVDFELIKQTRSEESISLEKYLKNEEN